MKTPKDSLLLIDGHALLYRAYHALPPLQNKQGIPTQAVYGFITTLFKAIEDIQPKYCAVAFDLSGPTFRHKAFDGYKAHRPETPEDLRAQVPYAYQVTEALNIPIFTKEGYEADDVIGTLAKQAKAQGIPVVIVTGDKDSFQLVDENTSVYIMRRSLSDTMLYDAKAVQERMGVLPSQIPDYKALAGDPSDAIPGISGIGDKTAATLLADGRSLDALYADLKASKTIVGVSEKIKQRVLEGEAIARQSLSLATIDRDVPIELHLKACDLQDYDAEKVTRLFQDLEFFSLIKRLPAAASEAKAEAKAARNWTHDRLMTKEAIEQAVNELKEAKVLAVDTETQDLHGPIIGLSLAAHRAHGYYIPLTKEHGATLAKEAILDLVRPLLADPAIAKVGHNIKYDMATLRKAGITLAHVTFDTMIAAYILHAHLRSFDFDSVAQRELGYTPIPLSDVTGTTKKTFNIMESDGEKLAEYAAEDAVITFRLYEHFSQELAKEPKLAKVASDIDFPLIPVLEAMEARGICVDTTPLEKLSKELDKEISQITKKIESYAHGPININSPIQLQKLLFEDLGLARAGIKSTQKGVSTAAAELEKLQGLHPIIDDIMRYRELTKLQNTYVKTLPGLVAADGRVHTVFGQATAATGRLNSNDPNLQNIPVRSELGNAIRKAFVAPPGYNLVSLDYSQFELRIIAHLSGDKALQKVFLDNRDIHDEVAKSLNIDRRAAKAINFGIVYGLSAFGLSQSLKIDPKVAKQYIDTYFATYSGVARYLEQTKQEIREKGYVETLFGRRREIPEIYASNAIVRAAAERQAINAPAQGSEADLIKLAMIKTHDWLEATFQGQTERPYLLLQVHDSLLLEVPQAHVAEVTQQIKDIMERIDSLSVPLEVDCSVGPSWGELEKVTV